MRIVVYITIGELNKRGLWDEMCAIKGWDARTMGYAASEGQVDMAEELVFTEEEAVTLGLLPKRNVNDGDGEA